MRGTEGAHRKARYAQRPGGADPCDRRHQRLRFFADFGLLSYDVDGKGALAPSARAVQQPLRHGCVAGAGGRRGDPRCDQNTDSFLLSVGQRDGRVRWKTPRPEAHSGHSTPIVYKPAGGAAQIILPGSFLLTAYAPSNGQKLWWVGGLSFEMKSTPVVSGDTLFINGFGTPQNQPGAHPVIPPFESIVKDHADAAGKVTFANLPNGRARRGSTWTRTTRSPRRMGLLPRGDGQRERHAGNSPRRPRRRHRHECPVEVSQVGAAAALSARLRWRALHGERRRDCDHAQPGKRAPSSVRAGSKGAIDPDYASPVAADGKIFMLSESGKVAVLAAGRKPRTDRGQRSEGRHLRHPGDLQRPGSSAHARLARPFRSRSAVTRPASQLNRFSIRFSARRACVDVRSAGL